tara:strand:- start:1189 stop:1497 length:309 start_codon:yes stop_codon:yes gene_type:complete
VTVKLFDGFFALLAALVAAATFYILVNDESASAADPYFWSAFAFIASYLFIFGYCTPMLIAQYRQHPQTLPIIVLNVVGGWSGICWLAALIWALYTPPEKQP